MNDIIWFVVKVGDRSVIYQYREVFPGYAEVQKKKKTVSRGRNACTCCCTAESGGRSKGGMALQTAKKESEMKDRTLYIIIAVFLSTFVVTLTGLLIKLYTVEHSWP